MNKENTSMYSNREKLGFLLLAIGGSVIIYSSSPTLNHMLSANSLKEEIQSPPPNLLPIYIETPFMIMSGVGIFLVFIENNDNELQSRHGVEQNG